MDVPLALNYNYIEIQHGLKGRNKNPQRSVIRLTVVDFLCYKFNP